MKTLFIFFILFFSLSALAEESDIYFCVSEENVGYFVNKNEKIHEMSYFKKVNFILNINFKKKTMLSEKVWLKDDVECIYSEISKTLYCISGYGAALSFYFPDKKYALSQLFVDTGYDDDLTLEYGYCEKF